ERLRELVAPAPARARRAAELPARLRQPVERVVIVLLILKDPLIGVRRHLDVMIRTDHVAVVVRALTGRRGEAPGVVGVELPAVPHRVAAGACPDLHLVELLTKVVVHPVREPRRSPELLAGHLPGGGVRDAGRIVAGDTVAEVAGEAGDPAGAVITVIHRPS